MAIVLLDVRFRVLLAATQLLPLCVTAGPSDPAAHRGAVEEWRAARIANLTSETGWLTLVALHPLQTGTTTFGRARGNDFRLDHRSLPSRAGAFEVSNGTVRFVARRGSGITHDGAKIGSLALEPDTSGSPIQTRSFVHCIRVSLAGLALWFMDQPKLDISVGFSYISFYIVVFARRNIIFFDYPYTINNSKTKVGVLKTI